MRKQVESAKPNTAVSMSAACILALGVSACSSDTMRFSESPFSNPFQTAQAPRDPVTTGSITPVEPLRTAPVSSAPMAPVAGLAPARSQPLPPPQSAVALRAAAPSAVVGSPTGWTAQGGTPVVVAQGETLDTISNRYGVPRSALIAANGLSGTSVAPGSRLIIPVYNAGGGAPRQMAQAAPVMSDVPTQPVRPAPAPAPAAPLAAARPAAPVRPVAPAVAPVRDDAKARAEAQQVARAAEERRKAEARAAEERQKLEAQAKAEADAKAMREARARFAAEAKAKADAKAAARPADRKPVAEAKAPAPTPAPAPQKPAVVAAAAPEKRLTVQPKSVPETKAAPEPKPAVAAKPAAPAPVAAAPESKPAEPTTTASLPKAEEPAAPSTEFRWPARGRVIAGYNGRGGNEGINIAVPEGTPVKAAEGGVVAYAGSELKGYGNLVLIRHPNGYVSAYAHNGELSVKRGETVKRGQVVAKSGQTGNVSSPQLHFELRKGSSPVDPIPYLAN